jgi:hypothetical protein
MTIETPPDDWVLLEAAERANIGEEPIEYLRKIYPRAGSFRALCDMIQKYEKPPADRKLLCAREAAAQLYSGEREEAEFMRGHRDEYDQVWCGKRAIELYEEGFGK